MSRKMIGAAALLCLIAFMTIEFQFWIGDRTIYAESLEIRRDELHRAILENSAPGGESWAAAGALSIQKRVGIVYLAEGLRRATGWATGKVYRLLDSVFLFASMLALFMYLRLWLPEVYCLIGVLYFCAVLPLTYIFQLFHPWDRPQLLLWIALLFLIVQRRFILLSLGLALSIFVKFDTILLPLLYFAVHVSKPGWRRVLIESLMLLALSIGLNALLGSLFPAPQDASRFSVAAISATVIGNAKKLVQMNVKFPPILVHLLPVLLAFVGLRGRERFVLYSVLFGLAMTAIHIFLTNYEEVRAHMMVLVLVLPAALMSVRAIIESEQSVARVSDTRRP